MKDLKYLAAFSIPLVCLLGLYFKGYWVWATPIFGFVCIPILELIFPVDTDNLKPDEADSKLKKKTVLLAVVFKHSCCFWLGPLWVIYSFEYIFRNLRICWVNFLSRHCAWC